MGEVFNALEVLNRTMKLGLSAQDVLRAEMGFKSILAQRGNPAELPADPIELAEGFEIVTTIQPRADRLSVDQLSAYARRELRSPRLKVDTKAMRQIDKALAASAKAPAAKAAPAKKTATAAKAKKSAKS